MLRRDNKLMDKTNIKYVESLNFKPHVDIFYLYLRQNSESFSIKFGFVIDSQNLNSASSAHLAPYIRPGHCLDDHSAALILPSYILFFERRLDKHISH